MPTAQALNIKDYVAEQNWAAVKRRLNDAYNETDYERAVKSLKTTGCLPDLGFPPGRSK